MSTFGPLTPSTAVERAVTATLKKWIVTYLAEVERQEGLDPRAVPQPVGWATFADDATARKWPETQMPAIVVMCPGQTEPPRADGDGTYTTRWAVVVAAICRGRPGIAGGVEEARHVAQMYATAISGCLLAKGSLGGFAEGVDWEDESNDEVAHEKVRTLAASRSVFTVEVDGMRRRGGGPLEPPEDPYAAPAEWPPVTSVEVETDRLPPTP